MTGKNTKMSYKTLGVRKSTKAYRKTRKPRKIGKKYGMGLMEYVRNLFTLNESLPKSKKIVDDELCRLIIKEFTEYPEVVEKYENPAKIATLRSDYNRGAMFRHEAPPEIISFQYDNDGNAINPRFIHKTMTVKEKEAVRQKYYKNYRDPWLKANQK